jgi:hypothetical protein
MNSLKAPSLLSFLAAAIITIAGCGGNAPEPTTPASNAPTPAAAKPSGNPLVVTEVIDVRAANDRESGSPVVIGSINGKGLMEGDKIIVNNGSTYGTFFGNDTWVTFSIPASDLGGQKSFTLQLVRPSTQEQSKAFTVTIK